MVAPPQLTFDYFGPGYDCIWEINLEFKFRGSGDNRINHKKDVVQFATNFVDVEECFSGPRTWTIGLGIGQYYFERS